MTTELAVNDISSLESWLDNSIKQCGHSANKQLLAKICLTVNAVMQHEDFSLIGDKHCRYYKMKKYWQWRYQVAYKTN